MKFILKEKRATLFACLLMGAAAYYGFTSKKATNSESNIMLENVEALSNIEEDDCHYINGYTYFTNKKGGAYDCCKVWVNKRPGDEHCR